MCLEFYNSVIQQVNTKNVYCVKVDNVQVKAKAWLKKLLNFTFDNIYL